MRKVCNSRYDIAGNGVLRALKLNILNKLMPVGNFQHGMGMKPAIILLVLHYCGGTLFKIIIRYERYFHRLYQIIKKEK